MKISHPTRRLLAALSLTFLIAACGGGGSSGPADGPADPPANPPPSAAKTGTVSILFTDNAAEDFDEFNATVTSIDLLGDSGNANVFTGSEVVNFLALETVSEIFTIAEDVPASDYNKIRLTLDKLELVKYETDSDPGEIVDVRLPGNGKVDLNPRGTFFVTPGTMLTIEMDMDVPKSLKLNNTGKGDKYQFRPVIFVKISDQEASTKLTRVFGTVESIAPEGDSLVLCQDGRISDPTDDGDSDSDMDESSDSDDCLTVLVGDGTGIFDENGDPTDLSLLMPGDPLTAIGMLRVSDEASDSDGDSDSDTDSDSGSDSDMDADGDSDNDDNGDSDSDSDAGFDDDDLILEAYVIEFGDMGTFARLKGVVSSDYDAASGEFGLDVAPGQGFGDDTTLTGLVQMGTAIFDTQANRLDETALVTGQPGHFEGVLAISDIDPDVLKTSLIVLDLEAPVGETLSGQIQSVNVAEQTLMLMTNTESRLVCLSTETVITLVTLTDTGTTSEEVELSESLEGLEAEVFGTEGTDGCFDAESIRVEDDQTTTPPANNAPVADAGPDQSVTTGESVMLDGSGSSDADGDTLSYSWTLTAPAGSSAALDDPTLVNPAFTTDVDGDYVAELIVNDGTEDSAPDSVTVTASTTPPANTAPVADAGPDQAVTTGDTVALDGTGSSDADGDTLTYSWTLSIPAGSTAALSDDSSATPSFTADVAGEYVAELVVNDGTEDSAADSVVITATGGDTTAPDGAALYGDLCETCHDPLAVSEKRGATFQEIKDAIQQGRGGMDTTELLALTDEEIQAIADALQ